MKTILTSALAASSLISVLQAGEAPATGSATEQQSLIGVPQFEFGRRYHDTDLPGYAIGMASYTHRFTADFDDLPGDVSSDQFNLWAPIIPLNSGRMHLFAMVGYEATKYNTSETTLLPEDTLQMVNLPIVFVHDISEEWIWGAMVMPSYAGNTGGDAFTVSGAVGVGYQWNPELQVFAGVYGAENFDDGFVVPGVGFIWRPAPRWEVNVLPPIGNISYSVNEHLMLSLFGRYESPTWNAKADSDGPQRLVNMSSFSLGLKAEYQLHDFIWGYVGAGYSMGQNLTVDDTSNRELVDDDIDASPFVQAGLNLRF